MEGLPPESSRLLTFSFSSQNRQYSVPSPESLPPQAPLVPTGSLLANLQATGSDRIRRPIRHPDLARRWAFPFPCTTNHSLKLLGSAMPTEGRWIGPRAPFMPQVQDAAQGQATLKMDLPLGSPPLRTVALRIASCPQLDAPTSQVGASTGTNFQPPVASNPATSQPLTTAPRNIAKHRHLLSTHPRHPLPSQLLPARYTTWPSVTTKVIDLRCAKNNPLSNHQSWMGISGVTQAAAVGPEGLGPGTPSFKIHR